NSSIDMTHAGTLRVDGTFSKNNIAFTGGTGTVLFAGNNQAVPSLSYSNLSITGTGTTTGTNISLGNGNFNVDAGSTFVGTGGTFGVQIGSSMSGSGSIAFNNLSVVSGEFDANTSFSVANNFTVNGTFVPSSSTVISGTGTVSSSGTIKVTSTATNSLSSQYTLNRDLTGLAVEYAGSSAQGVTGGTYSTLIINNPVSASLQGNVTVTGTLTLTSGTLIDNFDLTLTNTSPSALVSTSGRISGPVTRAFATGTNTYSFPLGSQTVSLPLTITVNAATVSGTLSVSGLATDPNATASGLDLTKDVNAFWIVGFPSGVIGSYDATFTFGSQVDPAATPASFVLRKRNQSTAVWSDVPATPAQTSITATGLPQTTATHVYAAGNQAIDH